MRIAYGEIIALVYNKLFFVMVLSFVLPLSCASISVETNYQALEIDKKTEEIRKIIIEREKSNQYWFNPNDPDAKEVIKKLTEVDKEVIKKLTEIDAIVSRKDVVVIKKMIGLLKNDPLPRIRALMALVLSELKDDNQITPVLVEALKQDKNPIVRINLLHALKISTNINTDELIYPKWRSRLVSIANDEGITLHYDAPPMWSFGQNPFLLTFQRSKVMNDYYQNQISLECGENIQQALNERRLFDEDIMVRNVAEKFLLKYSSP